MNNRLLYKFLLALTVILLVKDSAFTAHWNENPGCIMENFDDEEQKKERNEKQEKEEADENKFYYQVGWLSKISVHLSFLCLSNVREYSSPLGEVISPPPEQV